LREVTMDEMNLIDPEFDNTEEEDKQIINEFKEIADVIRDSTDVYGI
tara:strand:- start:371 stop:511 length:141 start_codon:yes stop_codon:yes gene_type:complete